MPEETPPAVEQGTGVAMDQIPTDFREYDKWRRTGELPTPEAKPPVAAKERAPQGEPESQAETAPDSEPDDSQEPEEPDGQPQSARPSSRQRRIDRLTRENADLQQRIAALEQRKPAAEGEGETSSQPQPAAGKPELKDFKTLEDYTEALTEWKLDQREAKRQEKDAHQSLVDNWNKKDKAAAKAHADYREVLDGTPTPAGPGLAAAQAALYTLDNGAEVLYQLCKRPAELKRIAALPPARAVLALGVFAGSIPNGDSEEAPENQTPKVTSAPKPPTPVSRGTTRAADNVYDEGTARDFKRWMRAREAQLKG